MSRRSRIFEPGIVCLFAASFVCLAAGPVSAAPKGAPGEANDEPAGKPEDSGQVRSRAVVKLILGSQEPAPLPKELEAWKHKLRKPPFSAFKSFRVAKTIRQVLTKKRRMAAVLVGPYVLHLQLIAQLDRPRPRYRFHLKLVAKRPKKKPQVFHSGRMLLDKGGTFFIAGPQHKGETLILAITLK